MTQVEALWLFGSFVVILVLLQTLGPRNLLEYDRAAIVEHAQYWRLLTGHLIHDSAAHIGLNIAALAVLLLIFPRLYSLLQWLLIALVSLAAIDAGLVWNEPQLEWYVGLSGCLHGILAAAAVAWWRYESKGLALLLTLVVCGKLGWEAWQGGLPFYGDMQVVVEAHLYGAIGGSLTAIALLCGLHRWSPRT